MTVQRRTQVYRFKQWHTIHWPEWRRRWCYDHRRRVWMRPEPRYVKPCHPMWAFFYRNGLPFPK
jgi:hypothetical protein